MCCLQYMNEPSDASCRLRVHPGATHCTAGAGEPPPAGAAAAFDGPAPASPPAPSSDDPAPFVSDPVGSAATPAAITGPAEACCVIAGALGTRPISVVTLRPQTPPCRPALGWSCCRVAPDRAARFTGPPASAPMSQESNHEPDAPPAKPKGCRGGAWLGPAALPAAAPSPCTVASLLDPGSRSASRPLKGWKLPGWPCCCPACNCCRPWVTGPR